MSDIIINLPTNNYHIPTQDEISILNTLFPKSSTKFIYQSIFITISISFINLIYLKYFNNKIPSFIYIIISIPLFLIITYYIQLFNFDHDLSSSVQPYLLN